MSAISHRGRPRPASRAVDRDLIVLVLVLIVSALFLFVDSRPPPIVLWDESRNAVNALEMRQNGLSLVTTYGFQPDLWNTKPPLLIWLMTGSMALFGPSEWALRLPSAIAALGTILLVMLFVRRVAGSIGTAVLAAIFLVLSPGFFGEHGARTADYDALLLFFVTAYLQLLFFAVHRPIPRLRLLLLAGAMIACATLTKSMAGLIPGAGVLLYLLLTGRVRRLWHTTGYAVMAATAAAPVLLFLLAREAQAPGYLDATLHNDLLGRFSESLVRRQGPFWYYAQAILPGWFFAGPLLLALPIVFRAIRGKSRALLLYSLCTAAAFLIVISLSSTKLTHYALPAFSPLAVGAAIIVRAIYNSFFTGPLRSKGKPAFAAAGLLLLGAVPLYLMTARSVQWRYDKFPERQFYPEARYGDLFSSLSRRGISEAYVIDRGLVLEGKPHYVPLLRAYQLMWSERGLIVDHGPRPLSGKAVLASCDPRATPALLARGKEIAGIPGCAAIRERP